MTDDPSASQSINSDSLANSDQCLSQDPIGTEGLTDSTSLEDSTKLVAKKILIIDGTCTASPDLVTVGPFYLKHHMKVDDPSALLAANSWSEFDALLDAFAEIETLVLLMHGLPGALRINGSDRTLAKLGAEMSRPGKPRISHLEIDCCEVASDFVGMITLAQMLDLQMLTGWACYAGFSVLSADPSSGTSTEVWLQQLAANEGYVLGSPSVAEIQEAGGMVIAWKQGDYSVIYPSIPTSVPEAFTEGDLQEYRGRQGYLQSGRAQVVPYSRDTDPIGADAIRAREVLELAYSLLNTAPFISSDDAHLKLLKLVIYA